MGLRDIARPHRERLVERTDEQPAPGVRSVAAPLRDGSGRGIAALDVNCHAAETSVERLVEEYLPLLRIAGDISADFARVAAMAQAQVSPRCRRPGRSRCPPHGPR